MLFPNPVFSEGMIIDLFNYADQVTYGGLGITMIILLFGIIFLMAKSFGTERAFTAASFITAICGVLFRFMFMKNDYVVYVSIILFVISLFMLKSSNDSGV